MKAPTAFFNEIVPLAVDSPAYHDILADGQAVAIKGNRTTPVLLVRRLVAVQPVRVLQSIMTTLADTLTTYAPHLPPALITPDAAAEMLRIAGYFPHSLASIFVLEHRLASDNPQLDLSFCIRRGDDGLSILSGGIPAEWLISPAWAGAAAFCQRWADTSSTLHREIGHVWFEFDAAGGGIPQPGLYFGTPFEGDTMRHWRGDLGWLTDEALLLLRGAALPDRLVATLQRCIGTLPDVGGEIFEVGMMLSRDPDFVRLCLTHIPSTRIPDYLAAVGWTGDFAAVRHALSLLEGADSVELYIDVGTALLPRAGLEARLTPGKSATAEDAAARWQTLLDRLVEAGLAAPDKGAGMLAWEGATTGTLPGETAPARLWRMISHIKIVIAPQRPLEAKGYLSMFSQPLPPRKRPPQGITIGKDHPLVTALRAGVNGEVSPPGSLYVRDFSRLQRKPLAVSVKTTATEDVIHTLKTAYASKFPVYVRGAGYSAAPIPDHLIALINNRPPAPEFDLTERGTVIVSGRTRLNDLEQALHGYGRSLPALPALQFVSVGGWLSAGGYGLRSHKHGAGIDSVRRLHLIGSEGVGRWCAPDDPDDGADLFRYALGGFGAFGVIDQAELLTIPYQPYTTMLFYDDGITPVAMCEALISQATAGENAPDVLRGWILPSGAAGFGLGFEHAQRDTLPQSLRQRDPLPREEKIGTFEDYQRIVHESVAEHLVTTREHHHLWADYLLSADALRVVVTAIMGQHAALAPYLYVVRAAAVKRPAGQSLPLAAHHQGKATVQYLIGVYADVPADDAGGGQTVQTALQTLQEAVIEAGGQIGLWGYHTLNRAAVRTHYPAAGSDIFKTLRGKFTPLIVSGVW
ncbi:MAG: FAD-binding oxidoreductase [Anaerolineales bacterium]|nr:FAD-binding oxidoreductase [Anaerolineales bacterium]